MEPIRRAFANSGHNMLQVATPQSRNNFGYILHVLRDTTYTLLAELCMIRPEPAMGPRKYSFETKHERWFYSNECMICMPET